MIARLTVNTCCSEYNAIVGAGGVHSGIDCGGPVVLPVRTGAVTKDFTVDSGRLTMEQVVCSWSGGKESALALESVLTETTFDVAGLMTTVAAHNDRTSIHGVRVEMLERQADALGLPIDVVPIQRGTTGEEYADVMAEVFADYADRGIERLILGDVFVEDDDDYRGEAVDRTGMGTYCPLLGQDTADLVRRFVDAGYEALTVCVEGDLGEAFAGRTVDEEFLDDLPASADLAGEDGEYHTFVVDGPIFDRRVPFERGKVVERPVANETMVYADLVPRGEPVPEDER